MHITNTPPVHPRRTLRRSFSLMLACTLGLAVPTRAADWYLDYAQPIGNDWHTLADWNSAADGSGTTPTSISSSDTYHANNYNIRTPAVAGPVTFGGSVLHLGGGASAIGIKTTGTGGAIIPLLKSDGGKIENSNGGTVYLTVNRLEADSGSTLVSSASGRTVALAIDQALTGSGELRVGGGGSTTRLSVANALSYLGQVRLSSGTLDFDAPWSSSGALLVEAGTVTLDQPVTVTALTVAGLSYPAGTHSFATLQAAHPAIFTAGDANGSITVRPPATWYLIPTNQPNPQHWMTSTDWSSTADGLGAHPTEFRLADTFDTNGKTVLRSPFVSTQVPENTFTGGQLRITSGATTLALKATSNNVLATLPSLYVTNGKLTQNANTSIRLRVDRFENEAKSAPYGFTLNSYNGSNAGIDLSIGRLIGSGILRYSGSGTTFRLSADDATTYTGDIYLAYGKINFDNAISSAGRLVIDAPAFVELDEDVTFTDLVIGSTNFVGGTEYAIGTYSLATLQANHPGMFTGSGGSITVRGPLDWYLTTSQVNPTESWNTLAHWNSATDGSGSAPVSINPIDNYNNQTNGRTVRTPEVASTFGGGELALKSGGKLMVRTPAGATNTIPTFRTEGGATLYNGVTGIAQSLDIGTWAIPSGTTVLTTTNGGAGGSFDLTVNYLHGAGNITVGGNSIVRPVVNHGGQYTGTLTLNSGASLTINQTFGIGGKLVVSTGASVTLNAWTYVTGLTVSGVAKPLGTYTAASLGFAGSGTIVVCQPTTDSPQMFGVNLAGAEFGGYAFWQTNAATWDYYQGKGLTLIRMPVKWNRIQSSLYGSVNFTQMDQCIALAASRGMKVIIDLHNYAAYADGTNPPRLGSTSLPISAMVDVWTKIADHYKNESAVYGYDLMNEPIGIDITVWSDAAQQTVDAIRQKDATHYVLVEGLAYSKATTWVETSSTGNVTLDIKDPIGRLIYSAHSYWDYKDNAFASPPYYGSDGVYRSDDVPTPDIGVNHVKPFVEWLKTRPYAYGNVGEYCVPSNYYSAGWNEAMGNFLQYLRDNNMGATYWAGGNNWTTSYTVCQPQPFPGTDKPQMAVLETFNNN
jgi:hypothetical protein